MRTLNLRKESLAELTSDELASVAGGTLETRLCNRVTDSCTGVMCLYTDLVCFE
ncbi:MAG TPA: class I lanthipeptide [Mycobacteriales bacterium]